MHGNVWEWCLDHWHDTYEGAPTDGSAWLSSGESKLRLLRGGSWYVSPWDCRSAFRYWLARGYQVKHRRFSARLRFLVGCLIALCPFSLLLFTLLNIFSRVARSIYSGHLLGSPMADDLPIIQKTYALIKRLFEKGCPRYSLPPRDSKNAEF